MQHTIIIKRKKKEIKERNVPQVALRQSIGQVTHVSFKYGWHTLFPQRAKNYKTLNPNKTKQNKTKQNKTKQNKTKQNKTKTKN